MPRFFNPAQAEFREDFIFQPNWELAAQALLKKDADYKDNIDSLALLGRVPIEFISEADSENVKGIREYYENQVNEIAQQFTADTSRNRYLVDQLRNKVLDDFEFGDIKGITDRYETITKFNENLEAMTNPAEREKYRSILTQWYGGLETPGKATENFTPPEIIEEQAYWNNFVNSGGLKGIVADGSTVTRDRKTGGYIVTDTQGNQTLGSDKIEKGFQAYMNSDPTFRRRAEIGQEYFGENDWFGEDGEFDFSINGRLGKSLIPGAESLAYSNTTSATTRQVDQYSLASFNSQLRMNEMEAQARFANEGVKGKDSLTSTLTSDASFVARFTPEGKEQNKKYLQAKYNMLYKIMTPSELESLNSTVLSREGKNLIYEAAEERAMKNPVTSVMLRDLKSEYEESLRAGYSKIQQYLPNQASMDKVSSHYGSPIFESSFQQQNLYFDLGKNSKGNNMSYYSGTGDSKSIKKLKPQALVGKEIEIPGTNGKREKIKSIEPVKGTGMPLQYDANITEQDLMIKGARMDFVAKVLSPYADRYASEGNLDLDNDANYIEIPITGYDTESTFNVSLLP